MPHHGQGQESFGNRAASRHIHVCPLCEAGCGLTIEKADGALRVRGHDADVHSRGFVCPKGIALEHLDRDPDRLRCPVERTEAGDFREVSWDYALDRVARGLADIQQRHGRDAVAVYFGTVAVHKYDVVLARSALVSALRTRNWTGVSALDTGARFVASRLLYGSCFSTPVPDIDRTAYFLCIGANPIVSAGSMMTAPNMRARIQALRERGGKCVVIDPRCSETARLADEHVPLRPGTDAAFLLGVLRAMQQAGQIQHQLLAKDTRGWQALAGRLPNFAPQRVAEFCGIPSARIEQVAHDFCSSSSSVAYCRMGPSNTRHGTLCCALVDVLNMAAGRLGQLGGAMFPTPAIDVTALARLVGADTFDRYRSRVRGLPEVVGEIPAICLAEEIETPGPGQVRGLLTFAGNPVLAVPNGRRLERALEGLEFQVAIDPYINETSRHADLILPPARHLAEDHLDLFFANYAVHNAVRWSDGIDPAPDELVDCEILLRLAKRLGGGFVGVRALDRLLTRWGLQPKPQQIADAALRLGPYGDRYLPWNKGLNLRRVRERAEGIDLGPLEPGWKRRVYQRGGRVVLDAPALLNAVDQLQGELASGRQGLLLIGRRELRSNNSWMHNLPELMTGSSRCVLLVNPSDAAELGLTHGSMAQLSSRVHSGQVQVAVSDEICAGVVSLPHGYGHRALKRWQATAALHAGVSLNDWTDDAAFDPISGQAVLNGVPVTLSPTNAGCSKLHPKHE